MDLTLLVGTLASMFIGSTANTMTVDIAAEGDRIVRCQNDSLSIACSHMNTDNGATLWRVSGSVMCDGRFSVDHNNPFTNIPSCAYLSFSDITRLSTDSTILSSVINLNTSGLMSDTEIECRNGAGNVYNVIGKKTLCVTDPYDPVLLEGNQTTLIWDDFSNSTLCTETGHLYHVNIYNAEGLILSDTVGNRSVPILLEGGDYFAEITPECAVATPKPLNISFTLRSTEAEAESESASSQPIETMTLPLSVSLLALSIRFY